MEVMLAFLQSSGSSSVCYDFAKIPCGILSAMSSGWKKRVFSLLERVVYSQILMFCGSSAFSWAMHFKSQRYNNVGLQKPLFWFICACYSTGGKFHTVFLNSPVTNCKNTHPCNAFQEHFRCHIFGKRPTTWKPVSIRNSVLYDILLEINLFDFQFHYLKNGSCGYALCCR